MWIPQWGPSSPSLIGEIGLDAPAAAAAEPPACASLNPTAHAEPARTTQAPTEQRLSSSPTIESRSSKNKEECALQEDLKSTFSR